MYFVYILQNEKDRGYYIGHTNNLQKRVARHNQGRSAYTRSKKPWKLIYQEMFDSKSEAVNYPAAELRGIKIQNLFPCGHSCESRNPGFPV